MLTLLCCWTYWLLNKAMLAGSGLIGIGLSRLFSASGLEREEVGKDERLANSMGLFLHKTK